MLDGKNIIIGVTGGVAAYKAPDIVSRLKKLGANVFVIMSKNSTKFIAPLTFQSLSHNYVVVDMFEDPKTWEIEHIELAKKADLFLIAPATANVIGKIASGIADDMLTTTIMATEAPVYIAPAMNTKMYENPIVQANINKLDQLGYYMISPDSGKLACGDIGKGKLASPEMIVKLIEGHFRERDKLSGKRIIVTAGPTIEAIDPVRYLTNRASGKMGYEIAKVAVRYGAEVTLITGPTHLNDPEGLTIVKVNTTDEMYHAVLERFENVDAVIKAAAPSDFKPAIFEKNKIKKSKEHRTIELVPNPDILKTIGGMKKEQILIGFAAETQNVEAFAIQKMKEKHLDLIVANNVLTEGAGFSVDTNIVTFFEAHGKKTEFEKMSKHDIAERILDKLSEIFANK